MAKEPEKALKAAVPAEAKAPKPAEAEYMVDELVDACDVLFGTDRIVARAALKSAGKVKYTEREAKQIVSAFKNKEVK